MLTKDELLKLLRDVESSRVERTVSTSETDKFCEAGHDGQQKFTMKCYNFSGGNV